MGAYLSEPITKKEISVDEDENFTVASASMQGWRVSQEDAHNAILKYDDFSSLFAVYDGHGGHEVAVYTAKKLPNFIKTRKDYRMGKINEGLVDAFVEFDRTITDRDVVRELRVIAGKEADGTEEVDHEEVDNLFQEATMPIEAVMAKNNSDDQMSEVAKPVIETTKPEVSGSSSAEEKPKLNSAVTQFKTRNGGGSKPISPFLRAKPSVENNSEVDAAAKLSFEEQGEKQTTLTNGNNDSENGHDNGHSKSVENGETTDQEKNEASSENGAASIKGKGKGKGKGKSSQIVKEKQVEDDEEDASAPTEPPKAAKRPKPKSAAELYQNLVNDEVMDEESEEEEDDDDAFGADEDSDDDDEDEDDAEGDESEDDEDDDTADDEDEEDDVDQFIGGEFNEQPGNDSGCTAVVALLVGRELFVANAGDSRCVVCRNGKAIEMSFDHKPEDDCERERIYKAGGRVTPDGRVNGGLNLSRALGDHAYKTNKSLPLTEQMISPVPDVKTLTIDPETDSFILLACDGIWNSLNSQEVVDFINEKLDEKKDDGEETKRLSSILEELFDHCLAPDTMGDGTGCDNMTAVIAKLKPGAFKAASGKSEKRPVALEQDEEEEQQPEAKKAKTECSEASNSDVKKEEMH